MFSQSISPTIQLQGGTFQVHHHAYEATVGTSEVDEDSQYLIAIT
jgi:hypothetical protein